VRALVGQDNAFLELVQAQRGDQAQAGVRPPGEGEGLLAGIEGRVFLADQDSPGQPPRVTFAGAAVIVAVFALAGAGQAGILVVAEDDAGDVVRAELPVAGRQVGADPVVRLADDVVQAPEARRVVANPAKRLDHRHVDIPPQRSTPGVEGGSGAEAPPMRGPQSAEQGCRRAGRDSRRWLDLDRLALQTKGGFHHGLGQGRVGVHVAADLGRRQLGQLRQG